MFRFNYDPGMGRPRRPARRPILLGEALERRSLLCGISYDPPTRDIRIEGSDGPDSATIRIDYNGLDFMDDEVEVSLTCGAVTYNHSFLINGFDGLDFWTRISTVRFTGLGGDDFFNNTTPFRSHAEGGGGNDRLLGGSGDDVLDGGVGGVAVRADNTGNDYLSGGAGDDTLYASDFGNNTLVGGEGNDSLYGYGGGDSLYGNGGNDDLSGGRGADYLNGGAGDDTLLGGGETDRLFGGDGDDTLDGGVGGVAVRADNTGDDELHGGLGNDVLHASDHGDNRLWGDEGHDFLYGYGGDDELHGGSGNDVLCDILGRNTLWGDAGLDQLYGGSGDDQLFGGDDADALDGGAGDDGLFGGVDDDRDTLVGGPGDDRFLVRNGHDDEVDRGRSDVQIRFTDGTSTWTDLEVRNMDQAFAELQQRTRSTRILKDTEATGSLNFVKEDAARVDYSGRNSTWTEYEFPLSFVQSGKIQIADWDERDEAQNRSRRGTAIHEIAHNWDSSDEADHHPAGDRYWDDFKSARTLADSVDDYARPYGMTNAHEDFATVMQVVMGYVTDDYPASPSPVLLVKQEIVARFLDTFVA